LSDVEPRVDEMGDGALLVTFGDRIDVGLNRSARMLTEAVQAARANGVPFSRPVPAYASVLIPFDPLAVDPAKARAIVTELASDAVGAADTYPERSTPVIDIEVRYGGADGPDMEAVAELHHLRPDQVVELHAGAEYRVFFLGFAPGFAYLGLLPAELVTPRLPSPRQVVPAGSVGIAGRQTGIYPFAMPGGWRIIGRTDARLWDLSRSEPALLLPGDRIRFVPVT
jgi:KipI family sensor histidine kinase inhibitor